MAPYLSTYIVKARCYNISIQGDINIIMLTGLTVTSPSGKQETKTLGSQFHTVSITQNMLVSWVLAVSL